MGAGAVALGGVSVAGKGHSGYAQKVSGAVTVQASPSGYLRPPYLGRVGFVQLLTNQITASGGGVFQFCGQPNRHVIWSIIQGTGNITPLAASTDAWGNAWAIYAPGGYSGPLTVGVVYGA